MIGRLNHVAIAVPDLAAAAATYREMLGARVSEPRALPDHGGRIDRSPAARLPRFKIGGCAMGAQGTGEINIGAARLAVLDHEAAFAEVSPVFRLRAGAGKYLTVLM